MSWSNVDASHFGYVAEVARDGRIAVCSQQDGILVEGETGKFPVDGSMPGLESVPLSEIVGWRAVCACGWRSDALHERGIEAGRLKAVADEALRYEWALHLAPLHATERISAAAAAEARSRRLLIDALARAVRSDDSWRDRGKDAPAVHQAWAQQYRYEK